MVTTQTEAGQPAALYGKQTMLALGNFPGPGRTFGDVSTFVRNYALVKLAAARANAQLGVLDEQRANAIIAACGEIAAGEHSSQFPSALLVGGGGTTTNMNINEVVAARATELLGIEVHPNDHVNASQSTNDTYPTAMAVTVLDLAEGPLTALEELACALAAKADEYDGTEHLGRTCLRDAVSVTAGQTHRSQAVAIRRTAEDLNSAVAAMTAVALGATVLGTGLGAPEGYREIAVRELAALAGRDIRPAADLFDALANLDPYANVAHAGARVAMTMAKVAADIRLLSSGPAGGVGDLTIPAVQAGSSIMPAKVNPAIPEYVMQLSYRVRGCAHTVECAVAAGDLELNVMEPVIVDSIVTILTDIEAAATTFGRLCVAGITWDGPRREENLRGALDSWVTLSATSGYEATTTRYRAQTESTATSNGSANV
ncbi:lyase family protein [Mycobacterium sp. 21AC1]|uniref:lyase family protein n=1 Tax=[Mycobacterium] appelbergii TaxID=2939269 RepID=UPI002938FC82|nr:lyase family protein [Mycobacterium sp. 21AC1]MDV3127965.1 lyase family protein [Mycobacterium sp. 21AC1]